MAYIFQNQPLLIAFCIIINVFGFKWPFFGQRKSLVVTRWSSTPKKVIFEPKKHVFDQNSHFLALNNTQWSQK
jgi:hypothetical protein